MCCAVKVFWNLELFQRAAKFQIHRRKYQRIMLSMPVVLNIPRKNQERPVPVGVTSVKTPYLEGGGWSHY